MVPVFGAVDALLLERAVVEPVEGTTAIRVRTGELGWQNIWGDGGLHACQTGLERRGARGVACGRLRYSAIYHLLEEDRVVRGSLRGLGGAGKRVQGATTSLGGRGRVGDSSDLKGIIDGV
jgi:hypothetical protein